MISSLSYDDMHEYTKINHNILLYICLIAVVSNIHHLMVILMPWSFYLAHAVYLGIVHQDKYHLNIVDAHLYQKLCLVLLIEIDLLRVIRWPIYTMSSIQQWRLETEYKTHFSGSPKPYNRNMHAVVIAISGNICNASYSPIPIRVSHPNDNIITYFVFNTLI